MYECMTIAFFSLLVTISGIILFTSQQNIQHKKKHKKESEFKSNNRQLQYCFVVEAMEGLFVIFYYCVTDFYTIPFLFVRFFVSYLLNVRIIILVTNDCLNFVRFFFSFFGKTFLYCVHYVSRNKISLFLLQKCCCLSTSPRV